MTLRDFVSLVAHGSEKGSDALIAVRRSEGFEYCTGEVLVDNCIGLSTWARKGHGDKYGNDWGIGKCEVVSIQVYERKDPFTREGMGEFIPCAVID